MRSAVVLIFLVATISSCLPSRESTPFDPSNGSTNGSNNGSNNMTVGTTGSNNTASNNTTNTTAPTNNATTTNTNNTAATNNTTNTTATNNTNAGCVDDSTCGGFQCDVASGACFDTCSPNQACAATYLCRADGMCVPPTTCNSNAPCGGYDCNNGLCRITCDNDNQCDDGYSCMANACVPPPTCQDNSTCGGYECNMNSNFCETSCNVNGGPNCDTDYECIFGDCLPLIACQDNGDCNGFECDNDNFCRNVCFNNGHCAQGYNCRNNVCQN